MRIHLWMVVALGWLSCEQKPSLARRVSQGVTEALPRSTVRLENPTTLKIAVKPDAGEYEVSLENLTLQCAKGEEACSAGIRATVANVVHTARAEENGEKL